MDPKLKGDVVNLKMMLGSCQSLEGKIAMRLMSHVPCSAEAGRTIIRVEVCKHKAGCTSALLGERPASMPNSEPISLQRAHALKLTRSGES